MITVDLSMGQPFYLIDAEQAEILSDGAVRIDRNRSGTRGVKLTAEQMAKLVEAWLAARGAGEGHEH